MVKKLVLSAVLFWAVCFAGTGCYWGGASVGVDAVPYYDGPYIIGGIPYFYFDGGFYVYEGGAYHFHHYIPEDQRRYYDERYRGHHEQYHRDYPSTPNQHPGHPGQPPRREEWEK